MSMLEGEEGVRADDDYAKGETNIPLIPAVLVRT